MNKPGNGDSKSDEASLKEKFLEVEYNTLRREIETSRDRHFKLAAGVLFIVPAVQVVAKAAEETGSTSPGITLMLLAPLPIVLLSLYVLYFCEHRAMELCATYIKENLEATVPEIEGWETWLGREHEHRSTRTHLRIQAASLSLFYGTLYVVTTVLATKQADLVFGPETNYGYSTAGIVSIAALISILTFVLAALAIWLVLPDYFTK